MKVIQVSDEDYKTLMELSKELQTQDNHMQAFPYFWEPSSKKRVPDINGEGEFIVLYVHSMGECYCPEELFDYDGDLRKEFLSHYDYNLDSKYDGLEGEWVDYLKDHRGNEIDFHTENIETKQEHNPSLFCSDVKNFIESNKHHLAKDPHTYARTIWRMPKMEALVKAVLRLNTDHKEEVNHEAARFLKDGK